MLDIQPPRHLTARHNLPTVARTRGNGTPPDGIRTRIAVSGTAARQAGDAEAERVGTPAGPRGLRPAEQVKKK